MAVNQRVFDTAIDNKLNNSKAVSLYNGNGYYNNFLVETDGTLRLLDYYHYRNGVVKISNDNGFTWTQDTDTYNEFYNYYTAATVFRVGKPPNGVFASMHRSKVRSTNYIVTCLATTNISIYDDDFDAGADGWHEAWGYVGGKYGTFSDTISGQVFASTPDVDSMVYIAYVNNSNDLKVQGLDLAALSTDILVDYVTFGTTNFFADGALSIKSKDNLLHVTAVRDTDSLVYIPFTKRIGAGTGSFGSAVVIASGLQAAGLSSFTDLAIDVNGLGHLCVAATKRETAANTNCSGYTYVSRDSGATWSGVYQTPPAGYSGYYDSLVGRVSLMNDLIGGSSGSFLLSSVFMQNGSGTAFVKEISSTENTTDTWRRVNSVNGNVIGAKFFKYLDEAIPTFGDKQGIRMAYQLGSTNDKSGQDTVTSRIFQERLSNLAYPVVYGGTQMLENMIDFYASGYIDNNTTLYASKINELGLTYSFSRYDPTESATVNGIGGYSTPVITTSQAIVDPGAYSFAAVARNNSDFSDYMERDSRKIFMRPDLFLSRNFIINAGGFLKRTIWTVRITGNDYEVAQIVPRFLDGKILYWEANLYVIGPSNDPWSKIILPSES